ncbi:MAG: PAS domain S-box protein [Proteobacteria bacterium]|nr:PAS domain S-box protein [Pseudomonadota bacterium]
MRKNNRDNNVVSESSSPNILCELALGLSNAISLDEAAKLCLRAAIRISGMDSGGIYIVDKTGQMDLAYHEGVSPEFVRSVSHYESSQLQSRLVTEGKPMYGIYQEVILQEDESLCNEGIRALGVIPVRYKDQIIASLNVASHTEDHFPYTVRQDLELMAAQIGNALARIRTEEDLRLLYSAVAQSTEGIAVTDLDGNLRFINTAFAAIHGYDPDDLLGKNLSIFHTPEQLPSVEEANRQIKETGAFIGEIWHVRRDGTVFPAQMRNSLLKDTAENSVGMIGTVRDITQQKQAEEALRESEERYRALFESAGDAVSIMTVSEQHGAQCIDCNERALKLFGFSSRDQIIGKNAIDLSPPVQPDGQLSLEKTEKLSRAVIEGRPQTFEWTHIRPDGTLFFVEVTLSRVEIRGELYLQAVIRDITERKQAETALMESEEKFKEMANMLPQIVYEVDIQGNLMFINEYAHKLFGYLKEDFEKEFDHFALLIPEDRDRAKENVMNMLDGEQIESNEYIGLRKDGSTFPLITYTNFIIKNNQIAGIRGIGVDITERKRAEEALRESEVKYKTLFESAGDALFLMDIHEELGARFLECNERTLKLFGCTHRDQIVGKTPVEFSPPIQPDGQSSQTKAGELALSVIEGQPHFFEWSHIRRDGTPFFVDVTLSGIELNGKSHMLAVVRDITERKRDEQERIALEKKVQQAQKLESLGVLAGGIAHDFNNLLLGVLGNADLAYRELNPESPTREKLRDIETAARRAADLTSQLLAYSGRGRFVTVQLDLKTLVEEMCHLLEVSISKKVNLKFDFESGVPPVKSDATQVRQIVMNLVTNASEAIGDKSGIVSIRTGTEILDQTRIKNNYLDDELEKGTYSYIEVADTGCGMDEDTLSRIFDPFFTTKFTGRGLGLAAVLGIVRGHKGALTVDSAIGKGTTFKVLLPSVEGPATVEKEPESDSDVVFRDKTILLVDDDKIVRTVTSQMLAQLGFDVVAAEDGYEALKEFKSDPDRFACVLLDLTMPRMNGEECHSELHNVRKDVRVILSSGYSEQESIDRFSGKGIAGFIQKPYNTQRLLEKLQSVLGKA